MAFHLPNLRRVALGSVPCLAGGFLMVGSLTKLWSLLSGSELVFLGGSSAAHAIAMIAVASLELTAALFLIFPDWKFPAITAASVILMLFSAYLILNYISVFGKRGGCGCGAGEQFFASQATQFKFAIFRNAVLLAGLGWYAGSAIKSEGAKTTRQIFRALAGLSRRDSNRAPSYAKEQK